MYIPDFWLGVLATLGCELVALISYGIYRNNKERNK